MTRTTITVTRLLRAAAATTVVLVALAVFVVLWELRPALPDLPNSLSSPVTTALIQQLVLVAAWLLAGLVVLVLLIHSILDVIGSAPRRAWAPSPDALESRIVRVPAGSRSAPGRPGFPPPFPLVLRNRTEQRHAADLVPREHSDTHQSSEIAEASVSLLGPVQITPSKRRGRALRSRTQEFVVYLALRHEGATTDELAAAIWPDVDVDTAKMRVWRSASEARSRLGEAVVHIGDRYVLDRLKVDVDIDCFNALLSEATTQSDADREQLLERACALVRGEPLAGIDSSWAAGETRHLRAVVAGLVQQLGELRLRNDPTAALASAEEAIALDPYAEGAQRLAMRAEAALGLREAIVERYEDFRRELDTKLGLAPERETRLLYRHLLSQDAGASPSPRARGSTMGSSTPRSATIAGSTPATPRQ
jgi:DNA-binding SARP family transcriptional activator